MFLLQKTQRDHVSHFMLLMAVAAASHDMRQFDSDLKKWDAEY